MPIFEIHYAETRAIDIEAADEAEARRKFAFRSSRHDENSFPTGRTDLTNIVESRLRRARRSSSGTIATRYMGKAVPGKTLTLREMIDDQEAWTRNDDPGEEDCTRRGLYRMDRRNAFGNALTQFEDQGHGPKTIVAYGLERQPENGFRVVPVAMDDVPEDIVAFEDDYPSALDVEMNLDDEMGLTDEDRQAFIDRGRTEWTASLTEEQRAVIAAREERERQESRERQRRIADDASGIVVTQVRADPEPDDDAESGANAVAYLANDGGWRLVVTSADGHRMVGRGRRISEAREEVSRKIEERYRWFPGNTERCPETRALRKLAAAIE